jgi:hypothetical protein
VILEVEQAVTCVVDVLGTALVDAAVQVPADALGNEAVVTHVVPSTADGDLVMIDGVIDLDKLARALVDGLGLAGVVE